MSFVGLASGLNMTTGETVATEEIPLSDILGRSGRNDGQ